MIVINILSKKYWIVELTTIWLYIIWAYWREEILYLSKYPVYFRKSVCALKDYDVKFYFFFFYMGEL